MRTRGRASQSSRRRRQRTRGAWAGWDHPASEGMLWTLTKAGRRYVAIGSVAAFALDALLLGPGILHGAPLEPDRRALVVVVGIPVVQLALAFASPRFSGLRWAIVGVSALWLVAVVLVMYEAALVYIPSGGLWLIGAVDRPTPRR